MDLSSDPKQQLLQNVGEHVQAFLFRVSMAYGHDMRDDLLIRKVIRGMTPTIRLAFLRTGFPHTTPYVLQFADEIEKYLPRTDEYFTCAIAPSGAERCNDSTVKCTDTESSEKSKKNNWPDTSVTFDPTYQQPRTIGPSTSTTTSAVTSNPTTPKKLNSTLGKVFKVPNKQTICYRCQRAGHFGKFCKNRRRPYRGHAY